VGQGCDSNADCAGGRCTNDICQPESCIDELENGVESDVDCGGDDGCARCPVGRHCRTASDCDGGACTNGKCQRPTCDDGLLNGSETDVDCGGICPSACADGLRCKISADCESLICVTRTLRCAAPSCDDAVLNGSEPSLDCGASCPHQCTVLEPCTIAEDCESGSCISELCLPSAPTDEVLSMQGWTATASHELGPSFLAQNAIDGALGTNWTTGADQVAGVWFAVDMQARQVFFSVELVIANAEDAGHAPAAVDVWLSQDGTFTDKALKNVPGAPRLRIDFDQPQLARHIRISLSPGVTRSKSWRIDELRVRQ
jgi:hypothetical protein